MSHIILQYIHLINNITILFVYIIRNVLFAEFMLLNIQIIEIFAARKGHVCARMRKSLLEL